MQLRGAVGSTQKSGRSEALFQRGPNIFEKLGVCVALIEIVQVICGRIDGEYFDLEVGGFLFCIRHVLLVIMVFASELPI